MATNNRIIEMLSTNGRSYAVNLLYYFTKLLYKLTCGFLKIIQNVLESVIDSNKLDFKKPWLLNHVF